MRPLAVGAAAFSAAVFAANYILPSASLLWLAGAFTLTALLLLTARRRWLSGFEIALISAALGLCAFSLYSARTTAPAAEYDGQTVEISAVLLDYPNVYDDYCRAEIRITDGAPRLKALLYDNDKQLSSAAPGQGIHLTVKLKAADTRYGKDYDYYNSKGIYFTASSKTDIEELPARFTLAALPAAARHALAESISAVFPEDTAGFMRSIMLGDKSLLYEDLPHYVALTRAGFMHIAAVSGMHVAFLVSFVQLLFGKTRRSSLICIALLWVFVAVTGFGPSAVRAGFMQSLLLLAPVVRRENDPATSLSTVLALVLLKNPHAAASVSLQLSFGAMAGILLFGGKINSLLLSLCGTERLRHTLQYPIGVAATSLAVMVITVPLTAVHFGYVSVLSPFMNIAALWMVSVCFCGGFVVCALAFIFQPLGVAAAWLVSWTARYIFLVASLISRVPFALLYLDNSLAALWLALTYALGFTAALTKADARFKILCPAALSAAMFFAVLGLLKFSYAQGTGSMAVLDVGQGQSIAVLSGGSSVVIDCGGGGKQRRAGESAGAYLLSRGHSTLDALVLTHLHADHANGVLQLMELVKVERIIMPTEPNDDDGLLGPILESAARHETEIIYISEDVNMSFGGVELELFAPAEAGDANERCVMCLASLGDADMLVTGDAPIAAEDELMDKHDISGVEFLVTGHHGSKYSSGGKLLGGIGASTAIISVGYNNYGHPTHQTLERLNTLGYNIYRTDLNGTVEIRIG